MGNELTNAIQQCGLIIYLSICRWSRNLVSGPEICNYCCCYHCCYIVIVVIIVIIVVVIVVIIIVMIVMNVVVKSPVVGITHSPPKVKLTICRNPFPLLGVGNGKRVLPT